MVNAWSLLYDELYGDDEMSEKDETKDETKDESSGPDTITFGDIGDTTISGGAGSDVLEIHGAGDYYPGKYDCGEDGLNMIGGAGSDTISFGNPAIVGSRVPGGMGEDHISFSGGLDTTAQDFPQYYSDIYGMVAGDDHIYFTGSGDPYPTLGSMGVDSFTPDLSHRKPAPNLKSTVSKKYQEDVGIKDLKDYVSSTYQGHYTNDSSDVQTLDLIHSVGDAESFCRSNALKYLSRYDKKGQAKRDILKAMHYCLLLYYFSGNTNNETPSRGYETF